MAGSLESRAGEWSTGVSDAVEVSRRLMAWCARAVGDCQAAQATEARRRLEALQPLVRGGLVKLVKR